MIIKTKKGDLPVKYGMNALAKYGDLTGKTIKQVVANLQSFKLEDLTFKEMLAFVYAGFYGGAAWEGIECKVKDVIEVGNMIDDDPELTNQMFNLYNDDSKAGEDKGDSKKK